MLRSSLLLAVIPLTLIVSAQNVGINANGASPHPSALLDVDASAVAGTKRGMLVPRVTTVEMNAIAAPATGLLVFNTTTNGFFFFNGTAWVSVSTGWGLSGNAGTTPATNFMGTTDAQPLRFRTANQFAGNLPVVASQFVSYGLLAGLNNTGAGNTFLGNSAGVANTTGGSNTFLGNNAGAANVASSNNTYVGTSAGAANVNGQQNVYIGRLAGGNGITGSDNILIGNGAGVANTANNNIMIGSFSGNANSTGGGNTFMGTQSGQATTTGGQNTFIGTGAGGTNTTGSQNTLIGNGASVNANNLTNATAIGRGSRVDASDALVLGSVNGVNAATATSRVGIGTTNPLDRLHVVGSIRMADGNQALGRVMVSDVNGTAAWVDPLAVASNLAWTLTGNAGTDPATNFLGTTDNQPLRLRVNNIFAGNIPTLSTGNLAFGLSSGSGATGLFNTFLGNEAGATTTTGQYNTFVGYEAGTANTTGDGNTYVGRWTGQSSTTGSFNTALGVMAGRGLTTGAQNVLLGTSAGLQLITGGNNVLIGHNAGNSCNSASNTMVGTNAGHIVTTGAENAFFGMNAGENTSTGTGNTFVGTTTGNLNFTGTDNTLLGHFSDLSPGPFTNATAIGAYAVVSQSNALVLGSIPGVNGGTSDVNVGIGITTPARALHVSRGISGATSNAGTKLLIEDNADSYAQFLTPAADESGLLFGNTVGSIRSGIVFNSSVADGLDFRTGGNNTRMVIDPTGRVGVGTSAPAGLLHVNNGASGGTPNAGAELVVEDNVDTYAHLLAPAANESGILFGTPALSIRSGMYFNSVVSNGLDFRTGSNTTQMVIDQGGNVGIGIPSPLTDLHVEGGVTFDRFSTPALAAGNNAVNVLDHSYLVLSSAFPNFSTVITLSNGFGIGQILIIECSAAGTNGFTVTDNNNTRLNGDHAMTDNDILTLIWNGADWLELSFAQN